MNNLIVLIDDDKITNLINQKLIERYCSKVVIEVCGSGHAGIECLKKAPPAKKIIILLDLNMPEFSGWDFMEALKEQFPDANFSIHILTSSTDDRDARRAEKFEMVQSFLSKPLTAKKIEALGIC